MKKVSSILLIGLLIPAFGMKARAQAETVQQEISDSDLTYAVENALTREKGVSPNDIDVSTADKVVTLSGSVDNLLARDRAFRIAESVRGVLGVVNSIVVRPAPRPDEQIRKDVQTTLLEDPATDSYPVAVAAHDGVVTLTGSVGSYAEKRLAGRLAEGVAGVKDVTNNIAINYLAVRPDSQIAADVNARLQWDVWINGSPVHAAVTGGVVTLTGTVGSAISKERAFDDAWVDGVTAVHDNDLRVKPGTGIEERGTSEYPIHSDSAMKQAVAAALRLDPRVAAFSPQVHVEDGVVILSGQVGNIKARTEAERDAREIAGVWRVDNFIQVRPPEQLADAEMQRRLKGALARDPLLDNAEVDAAVINRVAYLSGDVDSGWQRMEAQDVASRVKGLVMVRNRLVVQPETAYYSFDWPYSSLNDWTYYNQPPYDLAEVYGPQPDDAQIKKRIEEHFIWSPFVERKDIHVRVDGGVATLTGTVGSWIGWNEANRDAREGGAAFVINRITVGKHGTPGMISRADKESNNSQTY